MRIDRNLSYLDLFSNPTSRPLSSVDPPPGQGLTKLEAEADAASRRPLANSLPAPYGRATLPVATEKQEAAEAVTRPEDGPLAEILNGLDVRAISPRQMANLSQDLYAAGVISWDEHSMLAYQPELQPQYDRTIGALTGEPADPDRPRDFVSLWEDRLAFAERHNPADHRQIQTSRHVLAVLKQIDQPIDLIA